MKKNSVSRFKVRLAPSRRQHVVQRKIALSVKTSPAQDRPSGIIAGRATSPCDVLVEPILGFILPETHQPPHLSASPLTIQKPARGLRPHTPRCPVYFVSHPKTLHITTSHTGFSPQYTHVQRDFPTRPLRRRIFRPGFSPPKPISPPDFSSPTPDFPRRIVLNYDRSQTKSQKMRVIGGK